MGLTRQVAVSDLAQQVVVLLGHDQAQVIDAGGRWWWSRLGLRHLAVDVATDEARNAPPARIEDIESQVWSDGGSAWRN